VGRREQLHLLVSHLGVSDPEPSRRQAGL